MIETDLETRVNIILVWVVKEGLFKDVCLDNINDEAELSVQQREQV